MTTNDQQHRAILQDIAQRAMLERGLLPDFSAGALTELERMQAPAASPDDGSARDLRELSWASIDNDDSLDLDQLTVAETLPEDASDEERCLSTIDAAAESASPREFQRKVELLMRYRQYISADVQSALKGKLRDLAGWCKQMMEQLEA